MLTQGSRKRLNVATLCVRKYTCVGWVGGDELDSGRLESNRLFHRAREHRSARDPLERRGEAESSPGRLALLFFVLKQLLLKSESVVKSSLYLCTPVLLLLLRWAGLRSPSLFALSLRRSPMKKDSSSPCLFLSQRAIGPRFAVHHSDRYRTIMEEEDEKKTPNEVKRQPDLTENYNWAQPYLEAVSLTNSLIIVLS